MDEDPNQPKVKQPRRTKKNFEGELIHCGCGKSYMSYPALSQHIKAKHENVAPEGTDAKPVKKPAPPVPHKPVEPKKPEEKPIACGCGRSYQSIASLKAHIKTKHDGVTPEGTDTKPEKPPSKKRKAHESTSDLLEEHKLKGESVLSVALEETHALTEFIKDRTLPLDSPKTCEEAFANYVGELPSQLNEVGLRLFTRYTCFLYDCLNKRGWEMDKQEKAGVYCKVNSPENVPYMSNFFVTTYVPFRSEECEPEAATFYQHLCEWLYSKGLTSSKLSRLQN